MRFCTSSPWRPFLHGDRPCHPCVGRSSERLEPVHQCVQQHFGYFAARHEAERAIMEISDRRVLNTINATMAVQAGVKPEILQKILGHADDSTTVDVYTHMDLAEILEGGRQVAVGTELGQVEK